MLWSNNKAKASFSIVRTPFTRETLSREEMRVVVAAECEIRPNKEGQEGTITVVSPMNSLQLVTPRFN